MNLTPLQQAYRDSLEDSLFSRKEKRGMIRTLEAQHVDPHDLARLRSYIFDLARERISPHNIPALLDWLEIANKTLLVKTTPETQSEVYFSPQDDCAPEIIRHLESAQSRLRICVFTISDNRISEALAQRARDGIRVRIVTDNDKVYDYGSDIQRLAKVGRIDVRVDRTEHHMHHKFAVIDDARVITGSYNWTRSADEYNHENVLMTAEPAVVDAYSKEFERLWDAMRPLTFDL